MDKSLPNERITRALREYAATEVASNRNLWPAVQQRVQPTARVQLARPRPRLALNFAVAFAIVALLAIGAALPGISQFMQPLNPLSPTSTQAAAATISLTDTPIPHLTIASTQLERHPVHLSVQYRGSSPSLEPASGFTRPQLTVPVVAATMTAVPFSKSN